MKDILTPGARHAIRLSPELKETPSDKELGEQVLLKSGTFSTIATALSGILLPPCKGGAGGGSL
jgi:hypothetical protein